MYQSVAISSGFKITCSASFANVDRISDEVKQYLEERELKAYLFSCLLGVRELVTNAVRHGSGEDPDKVVCFRLILKDNAISADVVDEGPGFNWRQMLKKNPDTGEKSGRGLAIIGQYFHEIHFNNLGNEVKIVMRLKEDDNG